MKSLCTFKFFWAMASLALILILFPAAALAWPATGEWRALLRNGVYLLDPNGDAQGSRNIVSDATHPAAYLFNDGTYIYFRMRLDQNPEGTGGQGLLKPYGWGFELDTDNVPTSYEWLILVDGISKVENIKLMQNTVQQSINDPSDSSEIDSYDIAVSGNIQIVAADTSFNGDQDYFLDFRFPYATFKQVTGMTDSTPFRLFGGSSSSANSLTESGADLLGASNLSDGFSDFVTPTGTTPTDGAVNFAANLAGTGDVTQACPGDTLFIRVIDQDKNYLPASAQTLGVTLTTPSGDSESRTLTETGPNTGWFTGSIPTVAGAPIIGDSTLQVVAGETVTVRYLDAVTANGAQNVMRTDTLIITPPAISIVKTTTTPSVASGGFSSYTITISNTSCGPGKLTSVKDVLPGIFSYVGGSTKGLTTSNPTISGQQLTWNGQWTIPALGSLSLGFKVNVGTSVGTFYNNASVLGSNFSQVTTGDAAPVTVIAPLLEIIKKVDKANARPGEELIYEIHYHNKGSDIAHSVVITDEIPAFTSLAPNSLRLGPANGTYAAATPLTDASDGDEGSVAPPNIVFIISTTGPDDSVPLSGLDEGKVYFKVVID
ncbi:MAG: DUF11 domain-containing protein [Desulfatibacillum sp.]|nr:DUF11 domain-containing protein [Desulfatibacillum sp.]